MWEGVRAMHKAPDVKYMKSHNLYHDTIPTIIPYVAYHRRRDRTLVRIFVGEFKQLRQVYADLCPTCYGIYFRINVQQGTRMCAKCGYIVEMVDSLSYQHYDAYGESRPCTVSKQAVPRTYSDQIYKRCNHFRYWLSRIQCKESNKPSIGVLDEIESEIMRINGNQVPTDLSYDSVKRMLKRLGKNRFYHNIFSIISYVLGRPVVRLQRQHEEILVAMFIELQRVFKGAGHTRANMLSYPYIIKKLCEVKGWNQLAKQIPCFKSRDKTVSADRVWREICKATGWPFIKSVN